jgi:Sulfatase
MWRLRRVYVVVTCVAACWLGIAFVVLPLLGDPTSFNDVSAMTPPLGAEASQASSQGAPRNFRGNVYHIIFDSYQSEAYQYFLDTTPELSQLPFTYFPNFRTNSSRTYFSLVELFSSDFYTPDKTPESWHNAAFQSGGMMAYLAHSGVQLHLYPHFPEYCFQGASCKTTASLERELLGEGRARQTAVDLWFLKLIPDSLKRELNVRFAPKDQDTTDDDVSGDGSFSNWDYGFSISDALSPSDAPKDRDEPYFSVQQFMRALDDEDSRPATGQYVFLHLLVPHGPNELDRDCNFVGATLAQVQTVQELYLQQGQCANKLATLLVKKLASLGRLDNSLIILQGDHGIYWHPKDLGVLYKYHPLDTSVPWITHNKDDSSTWPSEVIDVRASALLLVKFPGQSTASRSSKPAEMIDIAPTILSYFDIGPGSMRGIPIQDMPEALTRDRYFFASNSIPNYHFPYLFSRYHYVDGKWKFEGNIMSREELITIEPTQ